MDAAAHFEKLLGAKSLDVAVAAQSQFVRRSFEKGVGQVQPLGELYLELARDVVRPSEGALRMSAK